MGGKTTLPTMPLASQGRKKAPDSLLSYSAEHQGRSRKLGTRKVSTHNGGGTFLSIFHPNRSLTQLPDMGTTGAEQGGWCPSSNLILSLWPNTKYRLSKLVPGWVGFLV